MPVMMHGPAFDSEGKTVNREVAEADVVAFEAAGYVKGEAPDAPKVKSGEKVGSATKEEAEAEAAAKAAEKAAAKEKKDAEK